MERSSFVALALAGVLLGPSFASATDSDIQLWPVVTLDHGINEKWGAHLQLRVRFDEDVTHTKDVLVRPYLSWKAWGDLHVDLGYDYLGSIDGRSENRLWLSGEYVLGWRDLTFANRVRFDQRWVENVDGVVARFRYRLRGVHPIPGSDWYGALSDEVFANLNDRGEGPVHGFEQNRLRAAVGSRLFGRVRAETGYEWQYVDRRSGGFVNRHVFLIELAIDETAMMRAATQSGACEKIEPSTASAKAKPSAATTAAPVGRSQNALAAMPALQAIVPISQPARSRRGIVAKKIAAHEAGTISRPNTTSTPASWTELVTTTPKLA
jgi:hypothetical protein